MTAKELREQLAKFPDEATVKLNGYECGNGEEDDLIGQFDLFGVWLVDGQVHLEGTLD